MPTSPGLLECTFDLTVAIPTAHCNADVCVQMRAEQIAGMVSRISDILRNWGLMAGCLYKQLDE